MEIDAILARMSREEKILFCTGADYWHTRALPDCDVPAVFMADGPHGVRVQRDASDMLGINESYEATCFPAAVTAGASWDEALYAEEGAAIAREASARGVSVVLGPGCNIKRAPLGGRSFEYLSEDPLVAGKMAAAFIRGIQGEGIGCSLKHFAANNQEYKRQSGDSRLDARALREIYLLPFEIAVREAQPETVMCSYNKINGTYASDARWLLTDILREEWGFDGTVVTDWGALSDRIEAFRAGCDLNMPGGERYMVRATLRALEDGSLSEADVDASVRRILRLATRPRPVPATVDRDAHHALARRLAERGAVLLKNEGDVLPLALDSVALFGAMAKHTRYQGSGSSRIRTSRAVSVTDALPSLPYFPVSTDAGEVTEEDLATAMREAARVRVPIVCVGLPDSYESEGFDRAHMRLPEGYDRLVSAIASVNPRTVVLLFGGGVMELPWADEVAAILYMGLAGEAVGEAVARLLTGEASPSGHLTESWPIRYEDVIARETFGVKDPEYRESVYVGYRYYATAGVPVRYPFGHGLTYTRFALSEMKATPDGVAFTVENTGTRAGETVLQAYVAPKERFALRPRLSLGGFLRVSLAVGERKRVFIPLSSYAFSVWADGWQRVGGRYTVCVGESSASLPLAEDVTVEGIPMPICPAGDDPFYASCVGAPDRAAWERLMGAPVPPSAPPKRGAFGMDHTVLDMKEHSLVMRLLYRVGLRVVNKGYRGPHELSDPTYRMMLVSVLDCPMRAMIICGGGAMKESLARGLLAMANGHFFSGLFTMLKKF